MERRSLSLAILILFTMLARNSIPYLRNSTLPLSTLNESCGKEDAETAFACGNPFPLSRAAQYDLELIPGISEAIAKGIISHKDEILIKAIRLPEKTRYKALLGIKGIGEKKAAKIARYIGFF